MGFSLNPYHYYKKAFDAIVSPDGQPTAPGVGGPAADPSILQHDAQTNTWVDPVHHTVYTDSTGQHAIQDPNIAQQVVANFQQRNALLQQGQQAQAGVNAATAQQQGLAQSLNNTINNPNAPSVAGAQLTAGADQIGRNQLAMASGVGGPNAAAARRQAALNIGNEQSQLNQQQAQRRVGEVQGAQGQLGGVFSNLAGQGIQQYGQDLSGAATFSGQAGAGAGVNQGANLDAKKASNAAWGGFMNGLAGAGEKAAIGA